MNDDKEFWDAEQKVWDDTAERMNDPEQTKEFYDLMFDFHERLDKKCREAAIADGKDPDKMTGKELLEYWRL